MSGIEEKIELLKRYFLGRHDISMAFIFGSYAKGMEISESDFDVAVYFNPKEMRMEWLEDQRYPEENKVGLDVERLIGIDIDLVVLNRVRPTVAFEILKTGIPLVIKDRRLYLEFYLIISQEAEDFREFIKDYWIIYQRSKSLSEEERAELIET
jgi:predicted nucleotidyltransferase